jgi:hypothetical protein
MHAALFCSTPVAGNIAMSGILISWQISTQVIAPCNTTARNVKTGINAVTKRCCRLV